LEKAQKLALEGADVRVVDVAVDDEGHVAAAALAPNLVGEVADGLHVTAARLEEGDQFRLRKAATDLKTVESAW
jgi:hypothetical protein